MSRRITLVFLVFMLAASLFPTMVKAQDPIDAGIYPSEGARNTQILIRFTTRNASIGNVESADFFWDDVLQELNKSGILGGDGSFNYWLTVPNQRPLSDLGNHTIQARALVRDYGQAIFNFTFTVVEWIPDPEYLALNSSYYELLSNYTALNASYSVLIDDYASLSANNSALSSAYEILRQEQNVLLSNFNSLSANYNSLFANHNALSANYNGLYTLYAAFLGNYTGLLGSFEALSSQYNTLGGNYSSLEADFHSLRTNYNVLLADLAISRYIAYAFVAATIVFVATTVYLLSKRLKQARGRF